MKNTYCKSISFIISAAVILGMLCFGACSAPENVIDKPSGTETADAADGFELSAEEFYADTSELFRIERYVQGVPESAVYYGFPEASESAASQDGRRVTFLLRDSMTARELRCRPLESAEELAFVQNAVIGADFGVKAGEAPYCSLAVTAESGDGSADEYLLDGEYYIYRKAEDGYERTARPLSDMDAMHLYAMAIGHIRTMQSSVYMLAEENVCAYAELEGVSYTLDREETRALIEKFGLTGSFEGELTVNKAGSAPYADMARIAFYNSETDDPKDASMFLCVAKDGSTFIMRNGFGLPADQYVYYAKAAGIISCPDPLDYEALKDHLSSLKGGR